MPNFINFKDWRTTLVGLLFAGASIAAAPEIDLQAVVNAAALGALGAVAGDAKFKPDPQPSVVPAIPKKPAKKKKA